jgi:aspartyl-tRNA(Asn)/glutamyl-tRNA(Gln) amidotransferase subunit A
MQPCDRTLAEALSLISQGELTAEAVVESCLERVDSLNDRLNALITCLPEEARASARLADQKRNQGQTPRPLSGLPIVLKDNFVTQGVLTSCASKVLHDFIPPYDGSVVQKLQSADYSLVGKANMDEFGMGSSNENSSFGAVKNPLDLKRVVGGSSGGCAASVAAGMALAALGTDTGGSVRQPAAFCGLTGLKPSYGRVSRFGIVAFASSLDQIGPITRDVRDSALLLNVISGVDPQDSTSSLKKVPDYLKKIEKGVSDLVVGVPGEYFQPGLDPQVEELVRRAIDNLVGQGARLVEVSLPHTRYAVAAYYVIASAEASSNLARYSNCRDQFGREVKRRIMLGTFVLSAGYYQDYYAKATKVRRLVRADFDRVFEKVDALLCPTTPRPPFLLGQTKEDPLSMYLADVYTIPASLAGLPALSIPCGYTDQVLPVGLQIIGRPFDEATVLRIGRAYEREHDWHLRRIPYEN